MKSSFLSNKNFIKYLPLILFVFSFLIYALMTCPTIYPRDNAEFVVAIHTLGIPHPPAYPLYVILGKIFTLLIPFGSIAFQANLMSGFFAALAISLLFLIIRKLTGDTTVALITALTLAFSRLFGFYALIADVFTLHIFWLLLIIYLLLKWQEKVIAKQKADNLLYWTAFLYGLGLGNHQTLIFLLLAIIYWVWTTDKKILLPKKIISFAAISLLGLIPLYLLVYLRSKTNPFLDWGNPETLTNLLAVFLRQEFGGVFLSKNFVKGWNFTGIISHFGQYFFSLNNQFHLWGIFGGLGGLIYLFLKKRRDFYFTFLAFLFLGPVMVFLLSNIPLNENIVFVTEKFYLASFAIFALWLGFGIWLILKWLTKIVSRIKLPLSQQIIIAALIIVFPLYNLVFNYSANNKHYYYLNYDYVSNVLKSLDPNAILITPNDSVVFGSWYFQQVENIRPDVIVIQTTPDEINHQQFRQRHPELFSGAQTQNKIFKKICTYYK